MRIFLCILSVLQNVVMNLYNARNVCHSSCKLIGVEIGRRL